MRITKEGDKTKAYPWLGKYKCIHCGCEFEIDVTDIKELESTDEVPRRITGSVYEMKCVCCEKTAEKVVKVEKFTRNV